MINMYIARLAGLVLTATLAISLAAASTASAEPHFRWGDIGTHFVGLSGVVLQRGPGGTSPSLKCLKDLALGIITSLDLVGSLSIHFLECKSRNAVGEECEVNSTNSSEKGLILWTTLHAVLGLILPRTGAGVGLLILPAKGERLVTFAGNACTQESPLIGSLAGEVTPVAKAGTLASVTFALTAGSQNIKTIDILGARVKPELVWLSAEATEETLETIHWLTAVEVT
jgi:hypothetical protein